MVQKEYFASEVCFQFLAQLDLELGWHLSPETKTRYIEAITHLFPEFQHLDRIRQRTILCNYHTEHAVVEALRSRYHPEHFVYWTMWAEQALRILRARYQNIIATDTVFLSPDDLVQEAMSDLWQALRTFRYESRFQTWAFTVICNCFVRSYRSLHAKKRTTAQKPLSFEELEALNHPLSDMRSSALIDEVAMGAMLAHLSQQVLARHPDKRLGKVFHLWMHEDLPLRAISAHLKLSVPRVHTLLNQALTLLRDEVVIQDWHYQWE